MPDQKNQTVIDTRIVPQRLYVKFRVGVLFQDDQSMELLDEFREDLAREMAFAVAKVLEGVRTKDGSPKYCDLNVESAMKVSHEMVDWVDF